MNKMITAHIPAIAKAFALSLSSGGDLCSHSPRPGPTDSTFSISSRTTATSCDHDMNTTMAAAANIIVEVQKRTVFFANVISCDSGMVRHSGCDGDCPSFTCDSGRSMARHSHGH